MRVPAAASLLAFLVSLELADLARELAAAAGSDGPVGQRLERALTDLVVVCAPCPQLCLYLLTQVAEDGGRLPLLRGGPGTPLAALRELLLQGQADGQLTDADPDLAVPVMVGAVLLACVNDPARTGAAPSAAGQHIVRGLMTRP